MKYDKIIPVKVSSALKTKMKIQAKAMHTSSSKILRSCARCFLKNKTCKVRKIIKQAID